VDPTGVFRSTEGKIWRVTTNDEGALRVEVLAEGEWTPGRVGMVGLRLSESTTRLSEEAIAELPE
jgi:hypothetical protein